MSRQRAKIYVRLFLALTLSVMANLLFQPRLVGGAGEVAAGPGDSKIARAAMATPRPRAAEQISDTIRAVQRELKDVGLFPGQIDGRSTPLTHAAVLSYEQANGLALTGEPTEELLKRLIMGPGAASPARSGPGLVRGSAADRLVADVRLLLSGLGYDAGRSDARLSPELIKAIRAYETDNGLAPPTGRITAMLLLHMQRKFASFKPR